MIESLSDGSNRRLGPPRVRIVVPCYNEEKRLDVGAFEAYLDSSRNVDFLLVNDGSADATLGVLRSLEQRSKGRVKVLDLKPNRGKGEAVRLGMLEALSGDVDYVGYFDADLATPLEAIAEFASVLDEHPQVDVVIGSRVALLGREIERKPARHYLGRLFATAASVALALPVYDTQCGAKLFRGTSDVRRLFERPFGSRWIFDVEIFARYLALGGKREGLYELPLRKWADIGDSRVKAFDFVRAGGELLAIYREYGLPRDLRRR